MTAPEQLREAALRFCAADMAVWSNRDYLERNALEFLRRIAMESWLESVRRFRKEGR